MKLQRKPTRILIASQQLAFSANGKLIGYTTTRDVVIILDVATGQIRRQFIIPSTSTRRYLASGANGDGRDLIAIGGGNSNGETCESEEPFPS